MAMTLSTISERCADAISATKRQKRAGVVDSIDRPESAPVDPSQTRNVSRARVSFPATREGASSAGSVRAQVAGWSPRRLPRSAPRRCETGTIAAEDEGLFCQS